MGRRPKPTAVQKASGAYKKDPGRENKLEPQPMRGAPKKPTHIKGPAAKKWVEVCRLLDSMQCLTTADGELIALFCETWAAYRAAKKRVDETGQVIEIKDENGAVVDVKRNPHSTELHRYADRLQKLCGELGLSPSARTRITRVDEPGENPLAIYEAME